VIPLDVASEITPGYPRMAVPQLSMNITPDLPFLNIHNPFTNEGIRLYLDKHSRMSFDKNGFFVKQISHLSKGVVIVNSA